MVFPLLGLAGLAVGSMALPYVQNYQDRIRGQYADKATEGFDMSDPNQAREGLLGAGLLEGDEFLADARTAFEQRENRRNQIQQVAMQQAGAMDRTIMGERGALDRAVIAANPANMNAETMRMELDDARREADRLMAQNEAFNQGRGANWIDLDPEDRMTIMRSEDALSVAMGTLDYIQGASGADRKLDPLVSSQYQQAYATAAIPFFQRMYDAGDLSDGQLVVMRELAGDPTKFLQFTDKQQGLVRGVIQQMQSDLANLYSAYGVNPYPIIPWSADDPNANDQPAGDVQPYIPGQGPPGAGAPLGIDRGPGLTDAGGNPIDANSPEVRGSYNYIGNQPLDNGNPFITAEDGIPGFTSDSNQDIWDNARGAQ